MLRALVSLVLLFGLGCVSPPSDERMEPRFHVRKHCGFGYTLPVSVREGIVIYKVCAPYVSRTGGFGIVIEVKF